MDSLNDYTKTAKNIATKYTGTADTSSMNDVATALVKDAGYTPDEIRTVVRMANVLVFEDNFEKRAKSAATDRMIEFEVGDAEVIIGNLHTQVKSASVNASLAPANFDQLSDLYSDFPDTTISDDTSITKVASREPNSGPQMSDLQASLLVKEATSRLDATLLQLDVAWESSMAKVAQVLRVEYPTESSRSYILKAAAADLGEEYVPEILASASVFDKDITMNTLLGASDYLKFAEYYPAGRAPRYKNKLNLLLKEASDVRMKYVQTRKTLDFFSSELSVK